MTAIISIGFSTEAFVPHQGAIPAFSHTPGPADTFIETVRSGIEHTGHVLAIYPQYASEPALSRLET
ncbi:MAG: hypothetical protein ACRDJ2_13295, partial [Actinomycetota bacterium]